MDILERLKCVQAFAKEFPYFTQGLCEDEIKSREGIQNDM